jgi:hypothetical protein
MNEQTGGWLSLVEDSPWWDDDGRLVEVRSADGQVVRGVMEIDAWFDGEEEVPIFRVKSADGRVINNDDSFQYWRTL